MKKVFLFSILMSFALFSSAVFASSPIVANPDTLIKGSGDAVYYYASDGKRYVFPSEKVYKSWFKDFSDITTIADSELAGYPLGGNVTYRPGYKMVKIQTDPKVYIVDRGGVLRWISSANIAQSLFGDDWANKIDDVPDSFFTNYTIGAPINSADEINLLDIFTETTTINNDKNISVSENPREATTNYDGVVDTSNWQLVETDNFSLLIPPSWEHVPLQGIDSIVGKFIDGKGIELLYDYGAFTSFYPDDDTKYIITYETIGGLRAQITNPTSDSSIVVKFENVTPHIDSFAPNNFTMHSNNLSEIQQQIALAIFRTIKFVRTPMKGFIPGQSSAITEFPVPANATSINIDFSQCSRGGYTVYFGFGSTSFAFEGIVDNKCVYYLGTEIENPVWDGAFTNKCSVPTNLGEQSYTVLSGGIQMEGLDSYCE